MGYADVIRTLIEAERESVGAVAVSLLERKVDFMHLDDDEVVFEREPTAADVEAVVEAYRDIQGKAAEKIIREALDAFESEDLADIDLPDAVLPPRMRADAFADAF